MLHNIWQTFTWDKDVAAVTTIFKECLVVRFFFFKFPVSFIEAESRVKSNTHLSTVFIYREEKIKSKYF